MQCPKCQSAMVKSTAGWLCPECGHVEPIKAGDKPAAKPEPDAALPTSNVERPTSKVESQTANAELPAPNAERSTPNVESPTSNVQSQAASPQLPVPNPQPPTPTGPLPTHAEANANAVATWTDTATGAASTVMPAPVASRVSSRLRRPVLLVVAAVVVLGLAGGAWAFQTFVRSPQTALVDYFTKLGNAKTAQFNGTVNVKFAADNDTVNGSISVNGHYDVGNTNQPKFDTTVKGTVGSFSVDGELMLLGQVLYLKLGSLGLGSGLSLPIGKDWYKLDLSADQATSKCDKPSDFLTSGNQLPINLPLRDVKLVALSETIDGHATRHYVATLDNSKLQAAIDAANKKLSADCKLTTTASDFNGATVSYDLWRGSDFDRLTVHYDNAGKAVTVTATFDTSHYNQPQSFSAPANARSLSDLFSNLSNGNSVDTTEPASSPDLQRKADLSTVKTALEIYFNDTNNYPNATYGTSDTTGLGKVLVPAYLPHLPLDPNKAKKYVYLPAGCTKTGCQSYKLQATLDNASDPSATKGVYTVTNIGNTSAEGPTPASQLSAQAPNFWQALVGWLHL